MKITIWKCHVKFEKQTWGSYVYVLQPACYNFCELGAVDTALRAKFPEKFRQEQEYELKGIKVVDEAFFPGFEFNEIEICRACNRPSLDCSADPCPQVVQDRLS